MIVQAPGDGSLLLITQPDHARLAARIMAAWDTDGAIAPASSGTLLFAIAEHDNGWQELDEAPAVNPGTGAPYDFMTAPEAWKQAIWPRGVGRLLPAAPPDAAALLAQHGLTIHRHRKGEPHWQDFFAQLEALREDLLARCDQATGNARDAFERAYDLLFLGDFLSLVFCNRWTEAATTRGYTAAFRDGTVHVSPDPFRGRAVALEVAARRIPNRRYTSDAQLRAAWEHADRVILQGSARGVTDSPSRAGGGDVLANNR